MPDCDRCRTPSKRQARPRSTCSRAFSPWSLSAAPRCCPRCARSSSRRKRKCSVRHFSAPTKRSRHHRRASRPMLCGCPTLTPTTCVACLRRRCGLCDRRPRRLRRASRMAKRPSRLAGRARSPPWLTRQRLRLRRACQGLVLRLCTATLRPPRRRRRPPHPRLILLLNQHPLMKKKSRLKNLCAAHIYFFGHPPFSKLAPRVRLGSRCSARAAW